MQILWINYLNRLGSASVGDATGWTWCAYAAIERSRTQLHYPHAWRYRDYVIASFNADKPYDQFIREQIAGDLLPNTRVTNSGLRPVCWRWGEVAERTRQRNLSDGYGRRASRQYDLSLRMAVTASCARCHDHKFARFR
ncbi:MAG: DUF1549 domain-containing protein [Planctomycetaceae bacterium]|nr:DUF1549 domain-containing protein [Planctomycetaceae bacterium]